MNEIQLFQPFLVLNKNILLKSLDNNGKDFEDSVIYTSAEFFDIKIIVTRDKKGFEKSKIKTATPKEFLESF